VSKVIRQKPHCHLVTPPAGKYICLPRAPDGHIQVNTMQWAGTYPLKCAPSMGVWIPIYYTVPLIHTNSLSVRSAVYTQLTCVLNTRQCYMRHL